MGLGQESGREGEVVSWEAGESARKSSTFGRSCFVWVAFPCAMVAVWLKPSCRWRTSTPTSEESGRRQANGRETAPSELTEATRAVTAHTTQGAGTAPLKRVDSALISKI